MKKISLFVIICLLLVGCNQKNNKLNKREVITQFTKAFQENVKSYDTDIQLAFKENGKVEHLGYKGFVMNNPFEWDIVLSIKDGTLNSSTKVIVLKDLLYSNFGNVWMKTSVSTNENQSLLNEYKNLMRMVNEELPSDLEEEFKIEENDQTYILTVNSDIKAKDKVLKVVGVADSDTNIKQIKYVIDKKTYLPSEIVMDVDGKKDGLLFTAKFANFNSDKKIVLPKEAENAIQP